MTMDKTDAQGFTEEPSAKAQKEAMEAADNAVEVVFDDEIAECETAEQGSTAEPSAEAQEEMLKEAQA